MKNLFFLLASILPFIAHSRDLSIGLRTGIGKQYHLNDRNNRFPKEVTWDKQAFIRYQSTKRFAIEAGFTHYSFHEPSTHIPLFFDGELVNRAMTYHFTNYDLQLQYDVLPNKLKKHHPIFKKFRNYFGITGSIIYVYADVTDDMRGKNGTISQKKFTVLDRALLMAGVNHTMVYKISRHFSLSSVLTYKSALSSEVVQDDPVPHYENHISYVVGLGYVF